MLAAVGATDRHLKLVLLVHGAIIGVIASVAGAILGLAGWFTLAHRLERAAEHRIDPFNLPWTLLTGALVAGVLVPIAAAWWPTRSMPRIRSSRDLVTTTDPRRAKASLLGAALFLAGALPSPRCPNTNPILLVGGMVSLVVGMLLACPTTIKAVAKLARRAPSRLVLRCATSAGTRPGRRRPRSDQLALGIPIAIVLVATPPTARAESPRRKSHRTQLLITIDHPPSRASRPEPPSTTADLTASIANIANDLDHAAVVPLGWPLIPGPSRTTVTGRTRDRRSNGNHSEHADVRASPELLLSEINQLAFPADTEYFPRYRGDPDQLPHELTRGDLVIAPQRTPRCRSVSSPKWVWQARFATDAHRLDPRIAACLDQCPAHIGARDRATSGFDIETVAVHLALGAKSCGTAVARCSHSRSSR